MAISGGTLETLDQVPAHVWKGLPDCLSLAPSAVDQSRVGESNAPPPGQKKRITIKNSKDSKCAEFRIPTPFMRSLQKTGQCEKRLHIKLDVIIELTDPQESLGHFRPGQLVSAHTVTQNEPSRMLIQNITGI